MICWKAFHLGPCLRGGSVTYTYDGDGRRAKKSNGKLYWYSVTGDVLAESDSSGTITSEYIYFNRRRIARRDPASGNVYYYLTDHIGSARVVTNSSGGVAEQSDFYPFGTERVLTDSLDNNYKFAGMERNTESALDHTLYRQYASNLARWLSPDPADGSPANPQSWNRYPYVLNDPLTLVDPQGATPQYDPYLVGCFPDPFFNPFYGWGCGWDDEDPCPPGYEPIYGNPRSDRRGGPAIETAQSLLDYANVRFAQYADFLSYSVEGNGVKLNFIGVDGRMRLGSLYQIQQLGDFIDTAFGFLNNLDFQLRGVGHSACTAYPPVLRAICEVFPEGPRFNVMRACLILLYKGGNEGYEDFPPPFTGITEDFGVVAHAICAFYAITHPEATTPESPRSPWQR
ncbi:MAG: RHS repeat-associated core domain-containing protein [Acidobacteria bacterium]|nr:RHS repeat-associated core domain-containing protein [Acidobacteriota bacterium]